MQMQKFADGHPANESVKCTLRYKSLQFELDILSATDTDKDKTQWPLNACVKSFCGEDTVIVTTHCFVPILILVYKRFSVISLSWPIQ